MHTAGSGQDVVAVRGTAAPRPPRLWTILEAALLRWWAALSFEGSQDVWERRVARLPAVPPGSSASLAAPCAGRGSAQASCRSVLEPPHTHLWSAPRRSPCPFLGLQTGVPRVRVLPSAHGEPEFCVHAMASLSPRGSPGEACPRGPIQPVPRSAIPGVVDSDVDFAVGPVAVWLWGLKGPQC